MSITSNGWKPGQSGNLKGRPPGTGDVAKLRAALADRIPQIIDSLAQRAIEGDVSAARLILDRVMPALKPIEVPQGVTMPAQGLANQGRAIIASVASGTLPISQGVALLSAMGSLAKIIEVDELLTRVTAIERAKTWGPDHAKDTVSPN